jgi:hypothetical protein
LVSTGDFRVLNNFLLSSSPFFFELAFCLLASDFAAS